MKKSLSLFILLLALVYSVNAYNHSHKKKFMVSISYSEKPDVAYKELIPKEKEVFQSMIKDGSIVDGFMVPDHTKGWLILLADSKEEAITLLKKLPLYKYMTVEIEELADTHKHEKTFE